jgi:hypothetical protein
VPVAAPCVGSVGCWDGSVVEGVVDDKSTYNLGYPNGMTPTSIEITFTISNWAYAD